MKLSAINKELFTALTCLLTATIAEQSKIAEASKANIFLIRENTVTRFACNSKAQPEILHQKTINTKKIV